MSKLRKAIGQESLSTSLRKALRLADRLATSDLRDWCRLELGGYYASNSVMTDDVVVPEYRSVVGQHADIYGRPLMVPADLSFVNETRLRYGVEELEALSTTRDVVAIHDPHMCEVIQEHLNVQVYAFRFSSVHVTGVLTAIGLELEQRLSAVETRVKARGPAELANESEILELRPNFYGIGVNLRALWRRWKGRDDTEHEA